MDSYGFIDSIQVEKANALARYQRFNNISKALRLIEVFIALALISWSSTRLPTVFKVSGEYIYACSSYMLNQHVVFLVGNVIVVICYILSGNSNSNVDVGNVTAGPEIAEDNRYRYRYKYRSGSNSDSYKTSESGSNIESEPVIPPVQPLKQAVMDNNNNNHNNNDDEEVRCEKTNLKSEVAPETVIKKATKQMERFQRTQSVKLRREMTAKPRVELRRSATERRRSVVDAGDGYSSPSSFETVERLSNEEFRLTVEAFILKQQSLLKQQSMVEELDCFYDEVMKLLLSKEKSLCNYPCLNFLLF
ncbi:hypothetical protein Hdeb2414_s0016g00479521 [Helianthus debilis subsp. tardiflorus]